MNLLTYNPAGEFRWQHEDVHERACACYNSMNDDPCPNICHYLISGDISHNGYPPVCGIDCEVSVLCWGGDDIDNSTIEAHCGDCVAIRHRFRRERRLREEAEYQTRREAEQSRMAAEEQRLRTLRDFWASLCDLEFERQCAELFICLGFTARTTPLSNDGAIDILLQKDGSSGAAQCKAWAQPCGVKELREFYGALHAEGMAFGYFIARGGITRRAALLLPKMPLLYCWTIDDLLHHATQVA